MFKKKNPLTLAIAPSKVFSHATGSRSRSNFFRRWKPDFFLMVYVDVRNDNQS